MDEPMIEILSIGNEVLQGDVLDTNSHWLCRQLARRGVRVSRITTLPDTKDIIAEAIREALLRRPALLLSCGGLGPTVDDLTASAVAQALGRPLREDPQALEMVGAFYAGLYGRGEVATAEVTPARRKMASVPEAAELLRNRVGAAPGLWVELDGIVLASLPGVPDEMKAMFEESLWPRLAGRLGGTAFVRRTIPTDCRDESLIARAVDGVAKAHPQVYVKSRAQVYGGEKADFVTLSARAPDEASAQVWLDQAEQDLRAALQAVGVHAGAAQPED
jgi:nicotinamide-nucleotide amidase